MSDDQWLLDSISGFLSSPGWALPVMSFIDENCVVFDDDDESQLAYTDIYGAFKEMVEMLLEMHLAAMGVTVEQFVGVVQKLAHTEAGRETVEQLLAVDDYQSFEKMMVKRNRELELEALKALESLSRRSAADAGAPAAEVGEVEEEEAMLQAALRASMEDSGLAFGAAEVAAKQIEKEEADLRMAIALSLQIQQEMEEQVPADAPEPPPEPLETKPAAARVAELEERLSKATRSMEASSERSHAILPLKKREAIADAKDEAPTGAKGQASLAGLPPLKTSPVSLQEVRAKEAMARAAETRVRAEEERESKRKALAGATVGSDVGKIAGQEMEARAAHLRKQRDLILAQRKCEREKAAAAEPVRAAPPAPPAAAAASAAPALDSSRAGLSRQLAAGMKAQLAGGDSSQLDARKADLEATKAALKAEFAANRS